MAVPVRARPTRGSRSGRRHSLAPPTREAADAVLDHTGPPGPHADYHLALWHGFNTPLLLTCIVIAGGIALYIAQRQISRLHFEHPPLGNADRIYDATLRGMDTISMRLTGATQRGSLPRTQSTILATLVVVPLFLLIIDTDGGGVDLRMWDSPIQFTIALMMISAAIAATLMRNRLASVILVGLTGYGCGVLFALHGAPDLALTQFLVETLTLVIFVLVLRKFPAEVDESKAIGFKWPRAALAVAVGITVTTIAAFATNARNTRPIYELLPDAAYDLGNGKNVVNVLLVDIRAWDTLGEISVLLVAATGVASLVFRNRRFGIAPRVADAPPPSSSTRQLPTRTRRGCAAETSSILDTVRWFSRSPRG